MCDSSIFYFSKDLDEGSPQQTCLLEFKKYVSSEVHAFGVVMILTSLVALFVFIVHFGMYCRPLGDLAPNDAIELPRSSTIIEDSNGNIPNNNDNEFASPDRPANEIPDDAEKVFSQPQAALDK